MEKLKPVIIIGAPRSGTNMLRNALCQITGLVTWPCDEINGIWRYGNARCSNDELQQSHATTRVKRYIHRSFEKLLRKSKGNLVIEKTCANSLRVPFIDKIYPEARYIFLKRDGRDVLPSAMKRWTAPFDLSYSLQKARYTPFTDLPNYAMRSCWCRWQRVFDGEKRLSSWGPRFEGMEAYAVTHELQELCAMQWAACIEKSILGFKSIDPSRVFDVHYEQFVKHPSYYMEKILDFIGRGATKMEIKNSVQNVRHSSVGKGQHCSFRISQKAAEILAPMLEECGYTSKENAKNERTVA